ncbi:MAG TPA: 2-methylcitrate dehydratase, partial [Roseovarius nubinhibens]|nr:2-methylcitrate dehydratase [Roseovarius nubinhibens]
ALQVMRLSLLDWLAVGLPGQEEPVARIVGAMVAEESGAAQATAFGGTRLPARAAALVNGTVSHALDYDDTHFAHIGHPSVAVVPAALALAEREGADMAQLVRAALQGCEMSVRIGLLLGRGHYQVGYHQTATAGT